MDTFLITPSGVQKLTSELELLRASREALLGGTPRGDGDEVASGFSAEVVDQLARLDRQIGALEDTLASATVVHPDPADGDLDVGEVARLRDLDTGEVVEYRIVGASEANPASGSISYASPVGAALLGRRVGDVIEVEVPNGVLRLEVLEIQA